ncbi:hypothetical protein A2U01_0033912, partial [Trifolium medium]|nr:hypothetical protein [Trifolium medium]
LSSSYTAISSTVLATRCIAAEQGCMSSLLEFVFADGGGAEMDR